MNSRRCEICNVGVHRASYIKHLRIKKHIENMKRNENDYTGMVISRTC